MFWRHRYYGNKPYSQCLKRDLHRQRCSLWTAWHICSWTAIWLSVSPQENSAELQLDQTMQLCQNFRGNLRWSHLKCKWEWKKCLEISGGRTIYLESEVIHSEQGTEESKKYTSRNRGSLQTKKMNALLIPSLFQVFWNTETCGDFICPRNKQKYPAYIQTILRMPGKKNNHKIKLSFGISCLKIARLPQVECKYQNLLAPHSHKTSLCFLFQ